MTNHVKGLGHLGHPSHGLQNDSCNIGEQVNTLQSSFHSLVDDLSCKLVCEKGRSRMTTFISFPIGSVSAISCLNPAGEDVAWWIHLSDLCGSSVETMYGKGLYFDSSLDEPVTTKGKHFTNLVESHLELVENTNGERLGNDVKYPRTSEIGCEDDNELISIEWFHELAKGPANPYDKDSDFKEGHIKMLLVQDNSDDTGYHISHSMRMPDKQGFKSFEKASINPSQHAFCNTLTSAADLEHIVKILKETKARPGPSNIEDCPSFVHVKKLAEDPLAKECDDKFFEKSQSIDVRDKGRRRGTKMVSTILSEAWAHDITKNHCMVRKGSDPAGPVKLGSFEVFSFHYRIYLILIIFIFIYHWPCVGGRKKTRCRDYRNPSWGFLKQHPDDEINDDNYEILGQCYAQRFGIATKTGDDDKIVAQTPLKIEGPKEKVEKESPLFCRQEADKLKRLEPLNSCNRVQICSFNDIGLDPWLVVAKHYDKIFYVSTDQVSFPSLFGPTYGVAVIDSWNKYFAEATLKTLEGQDDEQQDDDEELDQDDLVQSQQNDDDDDDEEIEGLEDDEDENAPINDVTKKLRKTHEKIMISEDGTIFCLGDSNRNDFSVHHAGSIYCMQSTDDNKIKLLSDLVLKMISGYNAYRQLQFDKKTMPPISKDRKCLANVAGVFYALDVVSPAMQFKNIFGKTKIIGNKAKIESISKSVTDANEMIDRTIGVPPSSTKSRKLLREYEKQQQEAQQQQAQQLQQGNLQVQGAIRTPTVNSRSSGPYGNSGRQTRNNRN
ncbi:hypothetical protein DFA_03110 [Cavenderia fasciculata]|uniref:Uncharacterized protein n=1 Tax=Cavenderia fasciculata TaxID=261658 RepID=F4PGN1_CACFS|nr:uncharacterized protein DFA_03110 [Cavenderia fasciculata]EGG24865.1 hypothetical protein DFA_03110 [Cavenderia fasciculata]|eukprot:XP_004362716.1 hypothetical protein DFA_03110 [Cavenderia fasciculata]